MPKFGPNGLLAKGEHNPIIWCERDRRYHKMYTFTEEDLERLIQDGARKLATVLDQRIVDLVYKGFPEDLLP